MRRTLILTALGATTVAIGLGAGATLASPNPAQPGPNVTTAMMANGDRGQMHEGTEMTQMMGSLGMTGMDADDMNAMHTTMQAGMSDRMSADQLAACDSVHAGMTNDQSTHDMPGSNAGHTAHHQGTQP
jgi:hypothetical protein